MKRLKEIKNREAERKKRKRNSSMEDYGEKGVEGLNTEKDV